MIAEVERPPGFQTYVYGVVPPVTVAVIEPLHMLVQRGLTTVMLGVSAAGSVMVTVLMFIHPMPSVPVIVYVLAHRPVAMLVVWPPVHAYVYGIVPPVITTVAVPLQAALQVLLVDVIVDVSIVFCPIVSVVV